MLLERHVEKYIVEKMKYVTSIVLYFCKLTVDRKQSMYVVLLQNKYID